MSRLRPLWAALFLISCGLLVATAPAQQPPGAEEEEKSPKQPGKKVPPTEEEEPGKTRPKKIEVEDPAVPTQPGGGQPVQETSGPYVARLDDVARAAAGATHQDVKKFLLGYTVAFDRFTPRGRPPVRVTPVPFLWGKDRFPEEFGLAAIDAGNHVSDVRSFTRNQVFDIVPFEQVVVEDVTEFLKPPAPGTNPPPPTPAEKYAAAERLLTAALFFHDTAREQNRRRGKNWDEVKTKLYDKLTAVRVGRVEQAALDKEWGKLRELSKRLIELYKGNLKVLEPVYAARLIEAEELTKSKRVADLERCRELLNEYVSRYPQSNNEAVKRLKASLSSLAKEFLSEAERKKDDKSEVRNLLQVVQVIDPENPALLEKQRELKTGYSQLVIGVRRMPEFMSPARARFDAEHQAVELLFEGLSEAVPDDQFGVRFHPTLALESPGVWAGVRDVQLVPSAEWNRPEVGSVGNADVDGTLRLLRERPGLWAGDITAWLDDAAFDPNDPRRVRLRFKVGHPDPRGLLTFKIQPASWLRQQNKPIDDLEFARKPFGSGPYRLGPPQRPEKANQKPDVLFVANPTYARRSGRMTQPTIKEVAFTHTENYADLARELAGGRIHILPDVPTIELSRYTASDNLGGRVKVVTAAQNRRIHILAINHRKPELQSLHIRRGLMHAIDRERILKEVYRGGLEGVHKALTGPFPVDSWASVRAASSDGNLSNRDLAQAEFRTYFAAPGAAATLSLLYADDDPQAKSSCEKIKAMIESATAMEDRKLTLNLEPLPPRELIRRLEEENRFDLAYVPFDYRDDWYPIGLSNFLDPAAAVPDGRNYMGFLSKEAATSDVTERLHTHLTAVRQHRDYDGQLLKLTHDIHKQFRESVPFIPLWQLDRHMVVSTNLKVFFDGQANEVDAKWLNPTTLFHSVGRWRME